MHENNFFVVFKKSMRKYIFETSNIFFITKSSKHVRVLAVCMQTYIYIYIYIYIKPGILNTRFVFLQYKNTKKNHKKIQKKQWYYSFF